MMNFEAINYRTGAENAVDQWMAVIGVLIGIELARRVVGNVFVIMGYHDSFLRDVRRMSCPTCWPMPATPCPVLHQHFL
jgi:hypothetical protein